MYDQDKDLTDKENDLMAALSLLLTDAQLDRAKALVRAVRDEGWSDGYSTGYREARDRYRETPALKVNDIHSRTA